MVRFYTCPIEVQSPKKWLAPASVLLWLQTIFSAPVELPNMMSWHSDFNESSHIILIIQSRLPCKNLI